MEASSSFSLLWAVSKKNQARAKQTGPAAARKAIAPTVPDSSPALEGMEYAKAIGAKMAMGRETKHPSKGKALVRVRVRVR